MDRPTLGKERFAEIKAKVNAAKAARLNEGTVAPYPPFTDEDMTFIPFDVGALREENLRRKGK